MLGFPVPNGRARTLGGQLTMDQGRKYDLEELSVAFQNARTPGEREYYERIIHSILNESDDIRYWREELLKASRGEVRDKNAKRRARYCIEMITKTRQDETAGHSWGSNKGNRMVN